MIKGELKTDYGSEPCKNAYTKTELLFLVSDARVRICTARIYQNWKRKLWSHFLVRNCAIMHIPKTASLYLRKGYRVRSRAKTHIPKPKWHDRHIAIQFGSVQHAYTKTFLSGNIIKSTVQSCTNIAYTKTRSRCLRWRCSVRSCTLYAYTKTPLASLNYFPAVRSYTNTHIPKSTYCVLNRTRGSDLYSTHIPKLFILSLYLLWGSELCKYTYTKTTSLHLCIRNPVRSCANTHIPKPWEIFGRDIAGSELHKTHVPKWRLSCKMNAMATVRSCA